MKQSFSNFCNQYSKTRENNTTEKTMQDAYDELKDLNVDELTMRLYDEVRKQKENGTFNYESLCSSVEKLRGFIPVQTYQNMKNMLEKIK